MNKLVNRFVILFLMILVNYLIYCDDNIKTEIDEYTGKLFFKEYEGGFITNSDIAIKYAEQILILIYGEESIENRMPLSAMLIKGVWYIKGTLNQKGILGGVPIIKICKETGEILGFRFGK